MMFNHDHKMKLTFIKIKTRWLMHLVLIFYSTNIFSQGYNHTWLLGYHYQASSILARMNFDSSSYVLLPEQRLMDFDDTEGNISDQDGNFLMSSNGIWIADSSGNMMLNGDSLNPGQVADDFHDQGLPMPNANLFLPMPNDTNKYVLFHQVANYNAPVGLDALEIYYSIIDKSLNGGLGGVVSKNNIALNGVFSWGLAACKHGNGRDWWIIALSDNATGLHTFLMTPDTIQYMGLQNFSIQSFPYGFAGQPVFSPNGEKFAFGGSFTGGPNYQSKGFLFNFDRCSGVFTLDTIFNYPDSTLSYSSAFSPDSKYLYYSTLNNIYQINTDTSNIASTFQIVAVNDTFQSTGGIYTNFYLMYLAANGKIYLTSGSSVLDIHEIDFPDSSGIACNVNLHNIHLPCLNTGTVPNHPNYYLGRLIGSPCDSLTYITEVEHDFKFSIFPNPSNGNFKIIYLLPQNKKGTLEIFDIEGRKAYQQNLPQWSTLQFLNLHQLANGVYAIKISSDNFTATKKLLIQKE